VKKLIARIGHKLGWWYYIPSSQGYSWWVVPRYVNGPSFEQLEFLFPNHAVPF